jgi:hypothetical protein
MFATIKSLIPEPRQATQPRHYVGRHRQTDPAPVPVPVPQDAPVSPAPVVTKPAEKTETAAA